MKLKALGLSLVPSAALLIAAAAARGQSMEPTTQDLLKRIDTLEKEVNDLRAQQQKAASSPSILDPHAVDTTVDAVMEDARRRSALFDADALSLHYTDGRLLLRSADGNFQAHPWFQLQVRYAATYREDAKQAGTSDDVENGFEIRRLKFGVDGNVITPNLTYALQFIDDRKSGNINLEMAWIKYHFGDSPFAVRAGQFKEPLDHEQLEATRTFAPAERTLVNDVFANGEGFVKGISLLYEPGERNFRSEVAFTDGAKNFNTNYVDYPNGTSTADWGVAGRAEYKLFGRWRDYDRFSAVQTGERTLVVGAGADYTEAGDTATLTHVADVQYVDPSGLMLYSAYLGQYTRDAALAGTGAGTADTYVPTFRLVGSYAINKKIEPFAEYSFIRLDPSTLSAGSDPDVHVITVGANYYLLGPALKVQFDLSYLPNGSPVNDDGAAILAGHANEFVVRTQLQLVL